MKKSTFIENRKAFWNTGWTGMMELINSEVRDAEAAGVKWDPEEEPLPNRLAVNAGAIYDPGSGEPVARIIPGPTSRQRSIEAVRRYNLVPEVRNEILRVRPFVGAPATMDRLLAILDGKEAP